jgi:hypothetical protein
MEDMIQRRLEENNLNRYRSGEVQWLQEFCLSE